MDGYKMKNINETWLKQRSFRRLVRINVKNGGSGNVIPINNETVSTTRSNRFAKMVRPINTTSVSEGISICLTAWKTADYIEECLDSIENQSWFKTHDNFEVLLGIDACEETLAKVKTIMHKYRNLKVCMMNENVGTYVTTNTMMSLAQYEWLLRFDTDDVMYPNMIESLLKYTAISKFDILRPYAEDFGKRKGLLKDRHGCVLMRKSIFTEYGGYKPWKCAADGELQKRLENYTTIKKYETIVFKRRVHSTNLTIRTDTGLRSKLRSEYKKQIVTPPTKAQAKIQCITSDFKIICNVIVSLTSYTKRFPYLKQVLESILNNSLQPYKICLCLWKDDVRNLPTEIKVLVSRKKIEVLTNGEADIKPHTKYYLTMMKYKNNPIITIDDDVIYSNDLIESLYESYLKFPQCVSARRVHKIIYKNGIAESYKKWKFNYQDSCTPQDDLFATGVGGVLYPPNILNIQNFNVDEILSCINADDIYLKYKEKELGVKTVWVKNTKPHGIKCLSNNDKDRLYNKNVLDNGNDKYLKEFKL